MPLPSDPATAARPDGVAFVRGRLMQQSLKTLLDRVRGSREVLPYLAALELSLGKGGSAVIDDIPAYGLAKICSQLSSLPLPQEDPALHDLLSRLMDRLEAHRSSSNDRPDFGCDGGLMVGEVSHTDFAAAAAEQATTRPSPI
ncbi:MAG: hypothetical protein Q8K96_01620 [Rubrivivax sp.]|nr:hypothetical protein [Rubrivivax sp.]